MTTAPAMPDLVKTVNAVVIRSSVLFERPVLIVKNPNKSGSKYFTISIADTQPLAYGMGS